MFRNTPLKTFTKERTHLGIPLWCQEYTLEQYWEVVQSHPLVLFHPTLPPAQLSQYLCLVRGIVSIMSMIAALQTHSSPAAC